MKMKMLVVLIPIMLTKLAAALAKMTADNTAGAVSVSGYVVL